MDRRHFLKLAMPALALAAGCRPSDPGACVGAGGAVPADLLTQWGDPVLGKLAASNPLLKRPPAFPAGLCGDELLKVMRRQSAADFAEGRLVSLDGWVLSETEALIHRAAYLASEQPAVAPGP